MNLVPATPNPHRVLSLTDHLEELRVRIIICLVWFFVFFMIGFFFAPHVLKWLIAPLTTVKLTATQDTLTLFVAPDGSLRVRDVAGRGLTTATLAHIAESSAHDRLAIELTTGTSVVLAPR